MATLKDTYSEQCENNGRGATKKVLAHIHIAGVVVCGVEVNSLDWIGIDLSRKLLHRAAVHVCREGGKRINRKDSNLTCTQESDSQLR